MGKLHQPAVSEVRAAPSWLHQLFHPGEAPLDTAGALREIRIVYPEGSLPLMGWNVNWLVALFGLSIAIAFALRRPLGVQI